MALYFGHSKPPAYRQWAQPMPGMGNDMVYPVGMAPHQFKPQDLSQQGPIAMSPSGPVAQATSPLSPASHPPMGMPTGMPVWNGQRPPTTPRPTSFTGMGNDVLDARGRDYSPPPNSSPGRAGPIVDGGAFHYRGTAIPPLPMPGGTQNMLRGSGGSGSYATPTASGAPRYNPNAAPTGMNWQPEEVKPPPIFGDVPKQRGGNRPKGPLLPGNSPPMYSVHKQGSGQFLNPGWWRDSDKTNKGGWWHDQSGTGQDLNKQMAVESGQAPWAQLDDGRVIRNGSGGGGGSRYMPGGVGGGGGPPMTAGMMGGGGGGGGGGYNPLQQFIDAMNAANEANASRANNLNAGYSEQRDYANRLLAGLGNQTRADTNTAFNNRMSQAQQSMIDSGLGSSSVMADQYRGNARDMASQMARNEEALLRERLGTELPLLKQQLDFNERINQQGPDANMLAQLAMQMGQFGQGGGAGGGGGGGRRYGAPMTIDSGSLGFQVPSSMMGYNPFGGGGVRYGSQLVKNGGRDGMMGGFGGFFPGMYPSGGGGNLGALPPSDIIDEDLILKGAAPYTSGIFAPGYNAYGSSKPYPAEYDFNALFPSATASQQPKLPWSRFGPNMIF